MPDRDSFIDVLPTQHYEPGKTLWNWMELLIIPFALIIGGYLLNRAEKRLEIKLAKENAEIERQIAEERNQEVALSEYFDRITELLLDHNLKSTKKGSNEREVARTRTLTILRRLNGERKGIVLNFLIESGLIEIEDNNNPIVYLNKADFSYCKLQVGYLEKANLEGTNFQNADLWGTRLNGANLHSVDFNNACLKSVEFNGAHFLSTRFKGANLDCSDFQNTFLENVFFYNASLRSVNFSDTIIENANFEGAVLDYSMLDNSNLKNSPILTQQQIDKALYIKKPPILPKLLVAPPKRKESDFFDQRKILLYK